MILEESLVGNPLVQIVWQRLQVQFRWLPVCRKPNDKSVENMKDIYMETKSTKYILYYDQSDPRVAQQRMRSKRQDKRNSTSQRRRQTSSNLKWWEWAFGKAVASRVFVKRHMRSPVGSEFLSESGHTNTCRISVGEGINRPIHTMVVSSTEWTEYVLPPKKK